MSNCSFYEFSSHCQLGKSILIPFPSKSGPPILSFAIFGCWNAMCLEGKEEILDFEIPKQVKKEQKVLQGLIEKAEKTGIIDDTLGSILKSLYKVETNVYGEKSVAEALKKYSQTHHLDAIVLAGDNVYEMLQVKKDDRQKWALKQLEKFLRNPKKFPGPGEFYNIQKALHQGFDECFFPKSADRFFVAMGNHDVENCTILNAELSHDKHFFFPAPYYDVVYGKFVHLIMIDTNMFSFKWKEDEEGKKFKKFQKHCDNKEYTPQARETQAKWVLKRIQEVNALWTILIGHIPLHAQGHKKANPIIDSILLQEYIFTPIQENKLRVQFYFAADEHNQQFLYDQKNHFSMIVAGSGGAKLDDIYTKQGTLSEYKFGESKHGFPTISLTPQAAAVSFWQVNSFNPDQEAKQVKSFVIDTRGDLIKTI